MKRIRILLADDHQMLLDALVSVLGQEFEIVGVASDGGAMLEMAGRLQPDIVVLDVKMPQLDGIDAARILHRILPSVPLILFSGHSAVFREEEAKSVSISAQVSKDESIGTLLGRARRLVHAD